VLSMEKVIGTPAVLKLGPRLKTGKEVLVCTGPPCVGVGVGVGVGVNVGVPVAVGMGAADVLGPAGMRWSQVLPLDQNLASRRTRCRRLGAHQHLL
jgi:hypothetical protein